MNSFGNTQDLFGKLSEALSKSNASPSGIFAGIEFSLGEAANNFWELSDFFSDSNPVHSEDSAPWSAMGNHNAGEKAQAPWDYNPLMPTGHSVYDGMKPWDAVVADSLFAGQGNGGQIGGPDVSAPSILSDMADFLTTDFWTQFGTIPREFNLGTTGNNPKNGVIHYNVQGYNVNVGPGADLDGLAADRQELVREIFKVYEAVLGIDFQETTSSDTNIVDIYFADIDTGAYANSTGFGDGIAYSYINVDDSWYDGLGVYDSYTVQTFFHEIGHAIGLGHQGLYNGTGQYPSDADFENDSWQATMMSYFSQTENTSINADFAFLQTPMSVDWIALNDIYAPQGYGTSNAFTGNTTWGFNTTITAAVSEIWNEFSIWGDTTAHTIVDEGGIDTLDLSGYSATQLINLAETSQFDTAPSISNIGGLIGNLTLAEGTIIENAVGGSGADTFFGNSADNILTGNAGNDYFNDSDGNDEYYGGADTDTVAFSGTFGSYVFSLLGNAVQVIATFTDLVEDTIEWFDFSDGTYSYADVINSISDAPNAQDDAFSTTESSGVGGDLFADNGFGIDSDPNGDPFTITAVDGSGANVGVQYALASGALVTVNANGTFNYDPNGAFNGLFDGETAVDSFTYTVDDGIDGTDTATVNITVNGEGTPPFTPVLIDFESAPLGAYSGEAGIDVAGLTVLSGSVLSGSQFAESTPTGFTMTATGLDFDLDGIELRAKNGRKDVTINAWDDGVIVGTHSLQVRNNSTSTIDFDALAGEFDSVDFVEFISTGDIRADDINLVTYAGTPEPSFSIDDVSQSEGDSGSTTFTFTVTRSGDTSGTSSVTVNTANDSATAGSDYTALAGVVLNFGVGQTTDTVSVSVSGDLDVEGDETFFVNLSGAVDATISDGQGVGTILNDDLPPPSLSIDDVSLAEGDTGSTTFTFTITRSGDTSGASSVTVDTANDSATAGSDYTALSGVVVNFAGGETTQTVSVSVTGDLDVESDETFFVNLSNASGAAISDGQGVGTIEDDDGAGPALVEVDFEGGSLTEDGFTVSNAVLSSTTPGTNGSFSAFQNSRNSPMVIERGDSASFDFDAGVFTHDDNKNRTLTVEGYLGGVLVASQSFNLSSGTEHSLSFSSDFDNVDQVLLDVNGPAYMYMDDLDFYI